jgi:cytosine/adenosine deaminase-related metal-dependent hydrolase
MLILKDAYLYTQNRNKEFGRYSICINEGRIADIIPSRTLKDDETEQPRVRKWIEQSDSQAQVIDCSAKLIIPPLINSCVKSEGTFVKYLLRNRRYEETKSDLCTDLIFNYIYQESETDEHIDILSTNYLYSLNRNLKSGVTRLNELSPRKDTNHLEPLKEITSRSRQSINCGYAIKQEQKFLEPFRELNLSYYLTDENLITVFDISKIAELRKQFVSKLFLEISTNKDVTEKFKYSFGKPIIALLSDYGLIDESTCLINPLYLSYDEIKILKETHASVVICPRDLIYFTNRYFPLDEFLNYGIKFSVGTGWLGEDLLKEARLLRHKFKELNLPSQLLFESVTSVPEKLFFKGEADGSEAGAFETGKRADMVFVDLSDLRFQLYPENFGYASVTDFIIDSLSASDITDVLINGEFVVKDSKLITENEQSLIEKASVVREKLYRIGKYTEIQKRKEQSQSVQEIDLSSRDSDEIKLFSDTSEKSPAETQTDRDEFRIKGKVPIFKPRTPAVQKNLFEEHDVIQIAHSMENEQSPAINLLYSELIESEQADEEIKQTSISEAYILKQTEEKKQEKPKMQNQKSKVELPKDVKLRFGDE